MKILVTAVLALLTISPLGADERLTIRVAPRMAMAPATVVVSTQWRSGILRTGHCRLR